MEYTVTTHNKEIKIHSHYEFNLGELVDAAKKIHGEDWGKLRVEVKKVDESITLTMPSE